MMAGGTIGGKEALDLVPPGDLGTLLERTVVHQLEVKKRHDRNYGERAKQLLEDLPVGGLVLFTDGGSNKIRSQTGWGVVVLQKNAAAQHPGAATGARRARHLAIVTYRGRAWPLAGRWYATRSDSLHEPRLLELLQCSLDRARAPSERPFPTDHPKGFPAKGPALLNSPPPRGLVGTRAEVPEVSAALGTKNASVH